MKAPEVLQVLSDKCRRMHLSYATECSYRSWVLSYIRAVERLPKAWPGEPLEPRAAAEIELPRALRTRRRTMEDEAALVPWGIHLRALRALRSSNWARPKPSFGIQSPLDALVAG